MAGENNIQERTINYRVYKDGIDYLGTASVELPEIVALSETVSGAGIAGEVETPLIGHFEAMAMTLTWRTIEKNAVDLMEHKAHSIELRSSQQVYDAANGTYSTVPVRISTKAIPKSTNLGSLEPNAQTDTKQGFEVNYLKMWVGGVEMVEIDKFNYIFKVKGKDQLAKVRKDLGL